MSAQIRMIKTAAETTLAEQFGAVMARPAGHTAVAKMRQDAFAQFELSGLPHRRLEAWHYTDLRAHLREVAPLATAPAPQTISWLAEEKRPNRPGRIGPRLFIVDGVYIPQLSDTALLPAGVSVRSLAEAFSDPAGDVASLAITNGLAADDPAVMLNTAFMQDGVIIEAVAGTQAETPLHIVSIMSDGAPRATYPRSLICTGTGTSLSVVETHHGHLAGAHQRNGALIFTIGDGSHVEHLVRLTDENPETVHLDSLVAELGAGSTFNSFAYLAGGGLTRRQIFLRFNGAHAKVGIRGVSLVDGSQHVDTTLVVDHAAPHCESRELFKYIVDAEGTGVFQGKIIVQPGAQKTDGAMKSQTLLLSDSAAMNNKPELEIFADDVVCGHGATVGQLDKDQLFYLMARGLPKAEAEALLLEAFAASATEYVGDEGLRDELNASVKVWLSRRNS